MANKFTDAELEAYLDETLDSDSAAEVEQALQQDKELLARLASINGRRDAGVHTLGEIWRRNQIGVPNAEVMGNYLLGVLTNEESDYILFRMDTLKCPFTLALYNDLKARQSESEEQSQHRREKFYQSSANLLKKPEE
ncbi:MAG: hypothetical protein AAFN77_04765 [Planctomycetota bacterium]